LTENIPIQTGLGFPEKENFCGDKKIIFILKTFLQFFVRQMKPCKILKKIFSGKKSLLLLQQFFAQKKLVEFSGLRAQHQKIYHIILLNCREAISPFYWKSFNRLPFYQVKVFPLV